MRLLLLLALLTSCTRPAPPDDVVIVTWDTTRADRVGPGAAVPGLTPGFDALAARGLLLTHARSPAPVTLPAHATLLTGLLPHEHGVRTNGLFALGPEHSSLAERFSDAGYATGAFVSATVLDTQYGLSRGFAAYDADVNTAPGGTHFARRTAPDTIDAALAWLKQQGPERPALLWVHLFDAHLPLDPPAEFLARHPDPYDAAIAHLDAETARLLDGVRARRAAEPVVVITADHGEGLGEHGERTHGYFAYDSTLRVPLVFSGPGFDASTDRRLAHLGDVAPTLAARFGLPSLGTGMDLRTPDVARSLAVESIEPVYAYGSAPLFGVLTPDEAWFDQPRPERYDLRADPGQLKNLWTDADADRAPFAAVDRRWPPGEERSLSDAEREQLIALGYLSADGSAQSTGGDLKDLLPVAALCMRVEAEALPEEVADEARTLIAKFGPLPMLSIVGADALTALGQPVAALAMLEVALAQHPEERRLANRITLARAAVASDQTLERDIRAALAANPDHPQAPFDLAVVVHRLGRLDEAATLYRAVLQRGEDVEARLGLARALGGSGDLEAAVDALSGDDPRVRCARGHLLEGRLDRKAPEDLAACP